MFCPEDGTKIEPERHVGSNTTFYPPCSLCNTRWVYNGEAGTYTVDNFETNEERTEAGWRARHDRAPEDILREESEDVDCGHSPHEPVAGCCQ